MHAVEALKALRREQVKLGQEQTGRFEKRLEEARFNVHSAIEEGDPRDRVFEFASKWKADLIFLGSHGCHGWKKLMLGSVSEAVARHAPCSVEIVRTPRLMALRKQLITGR